jgi:hypothetical protein
MASLNTLDYLHTKENQQYNMNIVYSITRLQTKNLVFTFNLDHQDAQCVLSRTQKRRTK